MTDTKIINPYINTYLNTTVRIMPSQMDNNIKKHIKNNLNHEIIKRLIVVSKNKKFFDKFIISTFQPFNTATF